MADQMKNQNEQQKLKSLVRELERELSQGKNQLEALGETQERLQQVERICHELIDENRQLREDISDWQKRFAESEARPKELSILKQQLDALQIEHDELLQSKRRMQEQLNLGGESENLTTSQSPQNIVAILSSEPTDAGNATGHKLCDRATVPIKETKIRRFVPSVIVQKWRIAGMFAGVLVLIIVIGMSIKALRTESPTFADPAHTETATAKETTAPASPLPSVAATPRVRGTFQTVRPTQVFSEPTEESALVASIAKGIRLNVVDSRDGWLEIRSKHGRPPGFVRRDEAVRVSTN